VAIGWHGRVLTSKNGMSWRDRSDLADDLSRLTYKDGQFLTATSRGGIWTSADGRAWVQKDLSDEMWAAGESVAKAAW